MPLLQMKGCCCFSLRTGALILGWLGLPSSILAFIGSFVGYRNIDYLVEKTIPHDKYIDPAQWKMQLELLLGIVLVIALINIIGCSTLILGAVKVTY